MDVAAVIDDCDTMHRGVHRGGKLASVFKLKDPKNWEWRDLRDYVVLECINRGVRYEGDGAKEKSMFSSFMKRWPDGRGIEIARYAFQISQGLWHGQLVSPTMFSKGFDPYFSQEIDKLLPEVM